MLPTRRLALCLGTAALAVFPIAATPAAPTTASAWLTTADGTSKLAPLGTVSFAGAPAAQDITIDPTATAQPFVGAGASITESSASLVDGLSSKRRNALMADLFGSTGIRLGYLRQPLGASDFVARSPFYTYEDTPGVMDFSRDQATILPLLQQARSLNPSLRLMGTPWSAPAWMKDSGSLTGGSLRSDRVADYAQYLVRTVQAYASAGVPLSDLTVGNEPLQSATYPSMTLTPDQEVAVVTELDRQLTGAGLGTRVYVYDHNWDHASYATQVLQGTTAISRVRGAAFHCYGGDPSQVAPVVQAGYDVLTTECSGTDSATPAQTFADTLNFESRVLIMGALRAGAESVVLWNLALDANGGPQQGYCGTRCNGVVTIQGGTVSKNAEYYALGHLSRFVVPGARRLVTPSWPSGGIQDVAYLNPDGSRVALVYNGTGSTQQFSITDGGRTLATSIKPWALETLTWS